MYGEINFRSFSEIMQEIRPLVPPRGVFYDLGCGTGRPVFAAALLCDFSRIIGMETDDVFTALHFMFPYVTRSGRD